jgi:hypothetical protein
MCPGRHIALRTLWDTIAAVLTLYDIGPGLNEDGTPNIPSAEFTGGLLRCVSILQYRSPNPLLYLLRDRAGFNYFILPFV